jgi:hypothetical protein
MSQKLKVLSILYISVQFLASCSSTYRAPESFDEKVSRYKPQTHSKNQTPELPTFSPQSIKSGRAPASVESVTRAQKIGPVQEFVQSHSPKRLYFLTLYTQYQKLSELKQIKSKAPEVCPHYHSTLVEHHEYFSQKLTSSGLENKIYSKALIKSLKSSPEKLAYFPELALPIKADSLRPRVIDLISHESDAYTPKVAKKMIDEAMSTHLKKTHSELAELCEFGSSDNYYIYENLIGRIERVGPYEAGPIGAQTMLKTGIVFNQALIKSLKPEHSGAKVTPKASRAPASVTKGSQEMYHHEALSRLKAGWMDTYFSMLGIN